MSGTGRIRVLVVDDHAVVREGLKLFLGLEDDIEVVGEASDGAEAIERAKELVPDVVLMDLVMPGTNGIDATMGVKRSCPDTQVLVLTSYLDDDAVHGVLQAGAIGYLMKDTPPTEVAQAVRTIHRGDPLLHPDALRRLIAGTRRPATDAPEPDRPAHEATTMTIAFTDIVNSSNVLRDLGEDGARTVFRRHDDAVRRLLGDHRGDEVQHLGDGFMTAFGSARSAVRFAIGLQRVFSGDGSLHPLELRVGVHTGEVVTEDHGYFGEAVWLAARIYSRAEAGQILISDLTRRLVGSVCPCADRGEFELKGIPGLHRLFEVQWREAPE